MATKKKNRRAPDGFLAYWLKHENGVEYIEIQVNGHWRLPQTTDAVSTTKVFHHLGLDPDTLAPIESRQSRKRRKQDE